MPRQHRSSGCSRSSAAYRAHSAVGVGRVAFDVVERRQRDALDESLAQVAAEARGMIGGDPDVLVHVEARHPRPVDAVVEHERVEEVELRIAGREHRVRDATRGDRLAQDRRRVLRGRRTERARIGEDADVQRVDEGLVRHHTDVNCGSHAFVAASISSAICGDLVVVDASGERVEEHRLHHLVAADP